MFDSAGTFLLKRRGTDAGRLLEVTTAFQIEDSSAHLLKNGRTLFSCCMNTCRRHFHQLYISGRMRRRVIPVTAPSHMGKFLYRKEYQPPQAADYTRTAKLTKRLE